jgi:GTP-binding nuclear protein Ran
MNNKSYKLVIVGDSNVGKSSLRYKLCNGYFESTYVPTLGVETKPYEFEGEMFTIWDTSGSPRYKGLCDGYYIGGDIFLVMFDLNNETSFTNVNLWITYIRNTCGDIPIVLCGNKTDISTIDKEFIDNKVNEINQNITYKKKICYVPISIKNNDNIDILNYQILSYLKP